MYFVVLALTAGMAIAVLAVPVVVEEDILDLATDNLPLPGVPPTPAEASNTDQDLSKEGCPWCSVDACPRSPEDCPSGSGFAEDPCGCCESGICGLPEGSKCYSGGMGIDLKYRALGACGEDMDCILRDDLRETNEREAQCICREKGPVCGSDNVTYSSLCNMKAHSHPVQEPDQPPYRVWLKHQGPCRAAPWVVTAPSPVQYYRGSGTSLQCEVKGYPAPIIWWERIGKSGIPQRLPDDDEQMVVFVRGGPEPFMATSWLQIMELRDEDVATYICIAANSEGETKVTAEVSLLE